MINDHDSEQYPRGRAGAHGSASDARTAAPASAPSSNYGAKEDGISLACPEGFRGECEGERVEFFTTGKHSYHVRYPVPDESAARGTALIDWLAFTLTPPPQIALTASYEDCGEAGYRWMVGELVRLFNVDGESIERKKGRFGFKHSALFPGGLIAWGGESQRGKIMVSLTGEGCARIEDWPTVAAWLEGHAAALKRVDLAYDDFAGETLSMEKVVEWYRADGFNAGGRKPEHSTSVVSLK